jgi:hypothetical protein
MYTQPVNKLCTCVASSGAFDLAICTALVHFHCLSHSASFVRFHCLLHSLLDVCYVRSCGLAVGHHQMEQEFELVFTLFHLLG